MSISAVIDQPSHSIAQCLLSPLSLVLCPFPPCVLLVLCPWMVKHAESSPPVPRPRHHALVPVAVHDAGLRFPDHIVRRPSIPQPAGGSGGSTLYEVRLLRLSLATRHADFEEDMGRWTCNVCDAWSEPYISVEPSWGTSDASMAAYQRVMEHAVHCYNRTHPPAVTDHAAVLPSFSHFMSLFLELELSPSKPRSVQWPSEGGTQHYYGDLLQTDAGTGSVYGIPPSCSFGITLRTDRAREAVWVVEGSLRQPPHANNGQWVGWLRRMDSDGHFMHAQWKGKGVHGQQWTYEHAAGWDEKGATVAPHLSWYIQHSVWLNGVRTAPQRVLGHLQGVSKGPTELLCWTGKDGVIDGRVLETPLHPRTGEPLVDRPVLLSEGSSGQLSWYVRLRLRDGEGRTWCSYDGELDEPINVEGRARIMIRTTSGRTALTEGSPVLMAGTRKGLLLHTDVGTQESTMVLVSGRHATHRSVHLNHPCVSRSPSSPSAIFTKPMLPPTTAPLTRDGGSLFHPAVLAPPLMWLELDAALKRCEQAGWCSAVASGNVRIESRLYDCPACSVGCVDDVAFCARCIDTCHARCVGAAGDSERSGSNKGCVVWRMRSCDCYYMSSRRPTASEWTCQCQPSGWSEQQRTTMERVLFKLRQEYGGPIPDMDDDGAMLRQAAWGRILHKAAMAKAIQAAESSAADALVKQPPMQFQQISSFAARLERAVL